MRPGQCCRDVLTLPVGLQKSPFRFSCERASNIVYARERRAEMQTVPTTLQEAIVHFSNPDTAVAFMVDLRWPNGVCCPYCGDLDVTFMKSRSKWQCKGCRKQFSVKAGTILEDSPIGLDKWICAVWMLGNSKNGVSSCEMARSLGLTQKTAWFVLHRVRRAMEKGTFEKLDGEVEADETWIGQKAKTMHSKKRAEMREKNFPKTCVFGLKERDGDVRTMVIPDTTKETLHAAIDANVEKDADVFTDTARGYQGLGDRYEHE